jgi:hypothetical protein
MGIGPEERSGTTVADALRGAKTFVAPLRMERSRARLSV